jgi:FkbM family methyltransferase
VHGVVHVGANTGQERARYDSYRLPVLWVEPIADVFNTLQRNLAAYPDQQAVQALLAEVDGLEVDFHIANNDGASSSMLDFAEHAELWPGVRFDRTVRMTTETLPTMLARAGVDTTCFDALVMDTQGSELRVLQGALPVLDRFAFVKAEAADFEAYAGCCRLEQLDAFMREHGFDELVRRRFRRHQPGKAYYDVVYRRRGGRNHQTRPQETPR